MTEWIWMKKDGIADPAQVTRESFRMCHQGNGWVEWTPPVPDPVDESGDQPDLENELDVDGSDTEDGQPPADDTKGSTKDSTSTRGKRPAAPKE